MKTQNLLAEMTKDELEFQEWMLKHLKTENGIEHHPATPRVYVRIDNHKKIVLTMTYPEKFAREYSAGTAYGLVIKLADGGEAYYDAQATRNMVRGNAGVSTAGNYPMASYACGISEEEIPEYMEIDRVGGVPTEYTKGPDGEGGDPIFRSKKHRREYCELHGLFDRNAGLSDPVPKNK